MAAKRDPAAIRYRNPGAMWGRTGKRPAGGATVPTNAKIPLKWGSTQTVYLSDGTGQGNNIAVFDTPVQGICAQLDLWRTSPKYKNKRFADAIATWSGGNNVPDYIAYCKKRVPGLTDDTIMNDAFWSGPSGIAFLKAQAAHEAGKAMPWPAADWIEAQRIVFGKALARSKPAATPAAAAPSDVVTAPAPVAVKRPGILSTLWNVLRGKDAAVVTTPEKARPGLHPDGDAVLYDQQEMLSSKGYTEVGNPDGLMGDRTKSAIREFRKQNGLKPSEAIDAEFASALLTAGPRRVAAARADATAKDLRDSGNSQIKTLDGFGNIGWLLGLLGIGGGVDQSGLLGKANDTLQTAQDTLGTIATVFQTIINVAAWCFAHWWIFAVAAGLYLLFKVAMGVLNVVVLFKQGFLSRADR
ncbi:peptidoglycan-binding protein [Tardiphaga sp.]|jgi:hypothetical protein|uniref:peptidoglycan-binding protein n=1 Tax=Tardiphaga sp. TaxID=1926292 RepID=UPI0037D9FBF8